MAHRIKIKLGDAEFEAEGTEELVQSQYEMFLAAMQSRSVAPTPSVAEIKQQDQTPPPAFTDNLIARIFELRPDDVVALRALPKGQDKDADALLLLLYGYKKLKNEEHVLATHLLKASSYSGIPVYRPAHALAQYSSTSFAVARRRARRTH